MGRGGQRWGRVCVSDRKLFVVHGTQGVIASTETGKFSRLLQDRASRSLAGPFRRPAPSSRTLQNGAGRVTARWPAWGPQGCHLLLEARRGGPRCCPSGSCLPRSTSPRAQRQRPGAGSSVLGPRGSAGHPLLGAGGSLGAGWLFRGPAGFCPWISLDLA